MTRAGTAEALDAAHTSVGRLAVLLGRTGPAGLGAALELLVTGLELDSAALRDEDGVLLALAGEVLHAVPAANDQAARTSVELPLGGSRPAALRVVGAGPDQLPLLRVAAAVLGLALSSAPPAASPSVPAWSPHELAMLAEHERDQLADELHDGPVQQLVLARYAADAAVRGGDARETRDAVQGALVALRRTMWHLRPRGSDLGAALEELSRRLAEGGQQVLRVTVLPGGELLTPGGAALAYRVVQSVALAGRTGDPPLSVTVSRQDGAVLMAVDRPLRGSDARLERWTRRAQILSGRLDNGPRGVRLSLPTAVAHLQPAPYLEAAP